MRCPACGSTIEGHANFCPYCGESMRGGDEDARSDDEHVTAAIASGGSSTQTRRIGRGLSSGPELTTCPACGANNSPRRLLCGRCGAELAATETSTAPATSTRDAPQPTRSDPGRQRPRRRAWPIVLGGALIGTLIGIIVWLAVGGNGAPEDAGTAFDPGVYTDQPDRLDVATVNASSTKPATEATVYDAALATDGDPATAWSEGEPGLGEGATLRIRLDQRSWVSALTFHNGDQRDPGTFDANARVARFLVSVDGVQRFDVALVDTLGEQRITLPEPVLATTLTFELLEAVPGAQHEDVALSEVAVVGWPARGADRTS